jgi:hypothetical protein
MLKTPKIFLNFLHIEHTLKLAFEELKIYDGEIAASSTKTAGKTG